MNARAKGLAFVRREMKVWEKLDPPPVLQGPLYRTQYVGKGRVVPVHVDFFGRYDFMAAWPEYHLMILVQASTETEGSHADPGPMGFCNAIPIGALVEDLMTHPEHFLHMVVEVYVYYRKLGPRGRWTPDRRWWRRED